MKAKIELSNEEVKAAVAYYISNQTGSDVLAKDVRLTISTQTDMRGEAAGHEVKAVTMIEVSNHPKRSDFSSLGAQIEAVEKSGGGPYS